MSDLQRCHKASDENPASQDASVDVSASARAGRGRIRVSVVVALVAVLVIGMGAFAGRDRISAFIEGDTVTHTRISSHDPSVVKANGKYYVFGSHRVFVKSDDLQHWEYFHDNLTDDYQKVLGRIWRDWPKQTSNPNLKGNMWAPEVIWNKAMKKWCMYLSVNGDNYKSVIVLLTADSIEGDWTYVGPVVYSGFDSGTVGRTDVPKVLGGNADLTRYDDTEDTEINAIDACLKYDGSDLWMAFGSWFGGIWMLKLDPATGLRDYATTYPTKPDVSDAYYGHKVGGGHGNSGEGTALVKSGGYWYMMLSYGGLAQTGGYQMREFRSRRITGPYVDQNGNPAVYTHHVESDLAFNRGLRMLGSYSQAGDEGDVQVSQGGNSLLADGGRIYNVYHTRFARESGDKEEHQVRVSPMVSADGWLVMAPYEKSGELMGKSSYEASDLAGAYQVVVHDPMTFYSSGGSDSKAIYHAVPVKLKRDGTLGGEGMAGTWKAQGATVSLTVTSAPARAKLHGTYTATVSEQYDDKGRKVRFLTGLGGDVFRSVGPGASGHAGRAAFWAVKR